MKKWVDSHAETRKRILSDEEYIACIADLISSAKVLQMKSYVQHKNVTCLEHTLYVSYSSYVICKKLGLDYRSAARGGLLHDFFLYDWHQGTPYKGLHAFRHAGVALENANKYFKLNKIEKEIIQKHMWPLNVVPPRFLESYVVLLADKFCAVVEFTNWTKRKNVRRLQYLLAC